MHLASQVLAALERLAGEGVKDAVAGITQGGWP